MKVELHPTSDRLKRCRWQHNQPLCSPQYLGGSRFLRCNQADLAGCRLLNYWELKQICDFFSNYPKN